MVKIIKENLLEQNPKDICFSNKKNQHDIDIHRDCWIT